MSAPEMIPGRDLLLTKSAAERRVMAPIERLLTLVRMIASD
jgi:hypothetical protein